MLSAYPHDYTDYADCFESIRLIQTLRLFFCMGNQLLIVGAGPFGLALAAQAKHERIEHLIVGKPMEFWRQQMPKGMFLRSACDWHLDPQNVHTIEVYFSRMGKRPMTLNLCRSSFISHMLSGSSVKKRFSRCLYT